MTGTDNTILSANEKWEEFYRKGKVYAVQIVMSTGGNPYDAEDILQDAAIEINNAGKIDKAITEDAYLITILKRINARRFNHLSNQKEWSWWLRLKTVSETAGIPFTEENAYKLVMLAGIDRLTIKTAIRLISEEHPVFTSLNEYSLVANDSEPNEKEI